MIDITDPRNEHLIAHPHFIKGVEHGADMERIRIVKMLSAELRKMAHDNGVPLADDFSVTGALYRGHFTQLERIIQMVAE
jgi:hypothetical protein